MSLAERLAETRARVADAASKAGRDPSGIVLVAVSKGHGPEAIREAYGAGQRRFGESYAQELAVKAEALRDLADLEWHFVGHLQSNKAKIVAPVARLVHGVDSATLPAALARRVPPGAKLEVLVEVNVGGEAQKHGARVADVEAILAAIAAERSLVARGFMTVAPEDAAAAAAAFEGLAAIRDRLGGAAAYPVLSMGMSDDLEAAIAAGATMVRVGTAIFGARG